MYASATPQAQMSGASGIDYLQVTMLSYRASCGFSSATLDPTTCAGGLSVFFAFEALCSSVMTKCPEADGEKIGLRGHV